jgi:hypothetical protein
MYREATGERKVILDPEQMAQMGIHQEIGITLPDGFSSLSPAQRRQWGEAMIAAELESMSREFAAMAGSSDEEVQQ